MSIRLRETVRSGLVRVLGRGGFAALRAGYWRSIGLFSRASLGESQSDEAEILDNLLSKVDLPQSFCEFGFHIAEFNCARLVARGWDGLLIDGDKVIVNTAAAVLARNGTRTRALNAFLTTQNITAVVTGHFQARPLGILSVDVDGNDYWLLRELLALQPGLIIAEYNASFGLKSLTTPYDPAFERHAKHESGWYHGASLAALERLCRQHGYHLAAVSGGGCNAFFLRADLVNDACPPLDSHSGYKENTLRNRWSGTTAQEQWARIAHLPFVEI